MPLENLIKGIAEYKMKEEKHDDEEEETVQSSKLLNFLEREKSKDKHVRDYDYQGRYDGRYHDGDYYERCGSYDDGFKFNPKLDIPKFDERMNVVEFLD